jgi:predicted PurR-regulated permease PerM
VYGLEGSLIRKDGFAVSTTNLMVAIVIIVLLYFGREVLLPIALAVLMSFVLAPLVRLLQRLYLPRLLAVIVVVLIAFGVVFSIGGLMVAQVNQLASDLPRYQSTLSEKVQALKGVTSGGGTLEQASEVLKSLRNELERRRSEGPVVRSTTTSTSVEKPIPVEVRQPDPGALQTLGALITPLIHPLATTGIVVIFVIFILLQQQDLRNRMIRLAGAHDLQRTTAAIDDAGQRLSRLFLTQLALNAGFGLVISLGLWLIGVPSAPLWGILAMTLRFVPYIGAIISAIFPLLVAAAVGPGWSMVLWTAALFLIVEPIVGHVIEPMVYGQSSGLSPVAVVASATFWTWLWGPIGLVLATPLTVCLVVLGRHVEKLKFLEIMLGDRPALSPTEVTYQRMLAGDPMEAAEQAETFLKEHPLVSYYDDIVVGGLRLAEADYEQGRLDNERLQRIRDTVAEIVDDLKDHEDPEWTPVSEGQKDHSVSLKELGLDTEGLPSIVPIHERWRKEGAVLCIPGGGLLDEAIAIILAQLLERCGIDAEAKQADTLSMAKLFALDTKDTELICLCYLQPASSAQLRYAARRIKRQAPGAALLIFAKTDGKAEEAAKRHPEGIEIVEGSLKDAVARIARIAADGKPEADKGEKSLPKTQRPALM